MENYIEISKLSVNYASGKNHFTALSEINLNVKRGEIFGFLGPNGAGKTTTIKTILGMIPEYRGNVRILKHDPRSASARQRIGYMPEIANYYWYLTPNELMKMYGRIFGISSKELPEKINHVLDLVGLNESKNKLMKIFSKGMMQKVSFAQSLLNDPELLILDEPTTGLDPIARLKMRNVIKSLKNMGKTIFFSSHELSEVEMICDEIAIIKKGKIITSGRPDKLLSEKKEKETLESYFINLIEGRER